MQLIPWYLLLCALQGALVVAPTAARRPLGRGLAGLVVPAGAMLVGVGAIRLLPSGAALLTLLATAGTPLAAAACGWAFGLRPAWWVGTAVVATGLWLAGWLAGGVPAEACRTLLIAAACLSLAALLGVFARPPALAAGLVALVVLDCFLVWGVHQVQPATTVLQQQVPPAPVGGRPLPSLQQVDLGNSSMGWLDLFAPALLGVLLAATPPARRRAGVVVAAAAAAWGLLLLVTSPIAATVPVLAGLAVTARVWARPPPDAVPAGGGRLHRAR